MKLVQLLAKELKEWPEGVVRAWQSGCDNEIYFDGANAEMFYTSLHADDSGSLGSKITRKQWQAEREKMNKPKWIRHRGGKCPVADDVKVLYRMRSGTITSRGEPSSILSWDHSKSGADIMAYRVIEETKDQEIEEVIPKHMVFGYASKEEMVAQIGEECPFAQVASVAKDTNLGTLTYKLEIDATEAAKEIDSLVAKWGQIESPLKWRDEIIELEAYEEEFRREREKLIRKLESEGFKLIDHVAPVYGEAIIGMEDYKNWRSGDIVEVTSYTIDGQLTLGRTYAIASISGDHLKFDCDDSSSSNGWYARYFKFIRRP